MTYVLILFMYAGVFSKSDSVTLTSVSGFSTIQQCQSAGEQAVSMAEGTAKNGKFVCVSQGKQN